MIEPPLLTRAQVRRVDAIAIEKYCIPGIVLMENAARAAAAEALALLRDSRHFDAKAGFGELELQKSPRAVILCGGGNNGGDGFAMARHLHNAGVDVTVQLVSDPLKLSGDAAVNFAIVERMKLPCMEAEPGDLQGADILIDAILGTGYSGELRPRVASAIERVNALRLLRLTGRQIPVIAVDLPSGLDCDTGIPSNPTILADVTVTFVAPKIGFTNPLAQKHLGRVVVADIGAPPEIIWEAMR